MTNSMKEISLRVLIGVYLLCFGLKAFTQEDIKRLDAGDKLPDYLLSTPLDRHVSAKKISDLLGDKWLLLDFWSTGCVACFHAFPKLAELQGKFADRFEIILVNPWQTDSAINSIIAKRTSSIFQLPDLPQINGDVLWTQYFPAQTVPHHVWVTPDGIIYAITYAHNADVSVIRRLLEGERVDMISKPFSERLDLRYYHIPDHVVLYADTGARFGRFYEGEGGDIHGYRIQDHLDSLTGTMRNTYINMEMKKIFQDFYVDMFPDIVDNKFAREFRLPLLDQSQKLQEIDDLKRSAGVDEWTRKSKFCYEFVSDTSVTTQARATKMFEAFGRFLYHHIGIEVSIAEMPYECLVLVALDTSKLMSSKDGDHFRAIVNGKFQMRNTPFSSFWETLQQQIMLIDDRLLVISDIDLNGSVDIDFLQIKNMGCLEVLNEDLTRHGLKLEYQHRVLPVLVIKDSTQECLNF